MRELCELLENITEEGYTVLFGQYDGSDELYIAQHVEDRCV